MRWAGPRHSLTALIAQFPYPLQRGLENLANRLQLCCMAGQKPCWGTSKPASSTLFMPTTLTITPGATWAGSASSQCVLLLHTCHGAVSKGSRRLASNHVFLYLILGQDAHNPQITVKMRQPYQATFTCQYSYEKILQQEIPTRRNCHRHLWQTQKYPFLL